MQTVVNLYPSVAVAGDRAGQETVVTAPYNATAEGVCKVGNFVFNGSDEGLVAASGSVIAGFAVRGQDNYNYTLDSEGTLEIPDGHTVTVAVEGDFYAETSTAATVGQKVFASTTDGSVSTGDAGGAVDGAVETIFGVKTAGDAGDLIVIGSFGIR